MDVVVEKIILGMCQTNCYYVYKKGSGKAILIDPADDGEYIYNTLRSKGISIEAILITHGHFDHIMGAERLRELTGAKVYAPKADMQLLEDPELNVSAQWAKAYSMKADEYFGDGDTYTIAGLSFKCILTPGHTIGSSCFYFEDNRILVCGDTLFYESVGRTDLPTGSMAKLAASVKQKLFCLPKDVEVFPGHGPQTDIEHEKTFNPFA